MRKTLSRKTLDLNKALNPSCIDPFITNTPLSFKNTVANSNGLFDFDKMVIAVMKIVFRKHFPIVKH